MIRKDFGMAKKVFVSGCFDLLHSGHVAFFQEAASYGDLYVALGSDKTVYDLKGRVPVNNEQERLFMVQSVSCVKDAFISQGSGHAGLFGRVARPSGRTSLIVNEDGNTPDKSELCEELGIEYVVLEREPHGGLDAALDDRCCAPSTASPIASTWPAAGWISPSSPSTIPAAVITISIEPTIEFNERSGMASSTRRSAIDLWGPRLPPGDPEKLAKMLFCYDNPPGTQEISGSQDAIGIVFPGLAKAYYEGEYWPTADRARPATKRRCVCGERALPDAPSVPGDAGFDVLADTHIDAARGQGAGRRHRGLLAGHSGPRY